MLVSFPRQIKLVIITYSNVIIMINMIILLIIFILRKIKKWISRNMNVFHKLKRTRKDLGTKVKYQLNDECVLYTLKTKSYQ